MGRLFSREHHWIEVRDGVATVGLTRAAVAELGDVTFVELPSPGSRVAAGDVLCVVESAKAAVEVTAPAGGTVVEGNRRLEEEPGLLSAAPETDGWLCRMRDVDAGDLGGLMSEEEYRTFADGASGG